MNDHQNQYVLSIMSRDRVGIVFEVANAIRELCGNIADIRQSVLCGYFTMILLVSFPETVGQRDIERKLAEVDAHSDTVIDSVVKPVDPDYQVRCSPNPENAYVLTASGADQIGFVATVASFCVQHKINILDLSTTVSDGAYVMILIIDLDQAPAIQKVRESLQEFSHSSGLSVVLQHYDIFRAVNEINLPIR